MVSAGILQDTPESVARFLRQHYGLSKVKIGEFLGEISMEFNMVVLEYVDDLPYCACMCVCIVSIVHEIKWNKEFFLFLNAYKNKTCIPLQKLI